MTQDTQQTSDLVNKDLLGRFAFYRLRIDWHWIAIGITVASIALLIILNLAVHKIEVFDSVEDDSYFLKASALLRGEPYDDQYHPPLYVVLTAGLSLLFNRNTFLSGSLISAL